MKLPAFKKTYGGTVVLNTPEIELERGVIYAVIGANGSGKSTFAKLLSGVEQSDDRAAAPLPDIGYMPQKSYAFRMSTKANIMLGGGDEARCHELMRQLHIDALAAKPAHRLSGGETARMALARLLMRKHELVILDEPTAAMDMESTVFAEKLMTEYVLDTGCTMLLVTHSLQQAKRIADMVLYFDKGELAEMGDKASVLNSPQDMRTKRFIDFYGL